MKVKSPAGQPVRIPAGKDIGVSSVGPIAGEAAILGVSISLTEEFCLVTTD